jgi:hypothetical protein
LFDVDPDRRFAAPRCWSRAGDSNRRSSLECLGLTKARSLAGVTALKPISELFSQRIRWQILAENGLDFRPFSKGERVKEDRQFESPLLQQRVSANRRSRSQPFRKIEAAKDPLDGPHPAVLGVCERSLDLSSCGSIQSARMSLEMSLLVAKKAGTKLLTTPIAVAINTPLMMLRAGITIAYARMPSERDA